MATNEIVQKLNSMMQEKHVFTQERDVVYFLVQLRKLMEREGIFDQHEVVKFYCDWVVHPNKEYNHRHMVEIYDAIYDECIKGLNEIMDTTTDSMFSLLKFDNLKKNVKPLIEEYGLSVPHMDSLWPRFAKTMLHVLNDQPLVKPSDDIKEIVITYREPSVYVMKVVFLVPFIDSRGYSHDDFEYGLGYVF